MASRKLSDLAPGYMSRFVQWLDACKSQGLDLLVTSTLRTMAEQDALYAIGRTKPGKRVTNAKAGQSAHNYGLALDFVPIVDGKPEWSGKHSHWQMAGSLAPTYGLEWAGTWTRFRELPHVQVPGWRSLVQ
jgi:peptidoglycan L-alanyl-D-glutamate endopeptidase CwlK